MLNVSILKPTHQKTDQFLQLERQRSLTYDAVGCTRDWTDDHPPDVRGFINDRRRQKLGEGSKTLNRARQAIKMWKMFPADWTEVVRTTEQPLPDQTVAVLIRACGCWWLNSARIIYVIDEPSRYGFAYGTLPGHAEIGEERFLVERDVRGDIWYDLRAISRPRTWLARAGYPLVRRLQRQFGIESANSIAEFCKV